MTEPLGMKQDVPSDRVEKAMVKFLKDLDYAEKSQTHLWTAIAHYSLSDEAAKRIVNDPSEQVILDTENLGGVNIGCFVCEEPLDARLVGKRCQGEPK